MPSANVSQTPILTYREVVNIWSTSQFQGPTAAGSDAAGDHIAWWGKLYAPNWTSGPKTITAVRVSYEDGIYAVGSVWEVSLRAVNRAVYPAVPSSSIGQFWSGSLLDIAGGSFTDDTIAVHTLNTGRTVSIDEEVVVYFRWSTFVSTAALYPNYINTTFTIDSPVVRTSTNSGGSWTDVEDLPHVEFICDDGSIIYFKGADYFYTAELQSKFYTSASIGTDIDGGDERGVLWIPKKTYDIDAVAYHVRPASGSSAPIAELCLYKDTTLLASRSFTLASENFLATNPVARVINFPLTSPIRVNESDNIRATVKPIVGEFRWHAWTLSSSAHLSRYFSEVEDNISITNRIDGGAWNTPTDADRSYTPLQFYGREVTGSALLSGSNIISGSVTNQNTPVEGATIRAIRQSDNIVITTSSNASGYYQFNLAPGSYHVVVEYESGSQKYNALSQWDVNLV